MTTRPIDDYGVDLEEILNELLVRYHRAVRPSGVYAASTKKPMQSHATTFVNWCTSGEIGKPVGRPPR